MTWSITNSLHQQSLGWFWLLTSWTVEPEWWHLVWHGGQVLNVLAIVNKFSTSRQLIMPFKHYADRAFFSERSPRFLLLPHEICPKFDPHFLFLFYISSKNHMSHTASYQRGCSILPHTPPWLKFCTLTLFSTQFCTLRNISTATYRHDAFLGSFSRWQHQSQKFWLHLVGNTKLCYISENKKEG